MKYFIILIFLTAFLFADENTDLTGQLIFQGNFLQNHYDVDPMDRSCVYDLVYHDGKVHIGYGNTRNTHQNNGLSTFYKVERPLRPLAYNIANRQFEATPIAPGQSIDPAGARIRSLKILGGNLFASYETGSGDQYSSDKGKDQDKDTDGLIYYLAKNGWTLIASPENPCEDLVGDGVNLYAFYRLDDASAYPGVYKYATPDWNQVIINQSRPPAYTGSHMAPYGHAFLFNGKWYATSSSVWFNISNVNMTSGTNQPWMLRLDTSQNALWQVEYQSASEFDSGIRDGEMLSSVEPLESGVVGILGNEYDGSRAVEIKSISPADLNYIDGMPGNRVVDITSTGVLAGFLSYDEELRRNFVSLKTKANNLEVLGYFDTPAPLTAIEIVDNTLYLAAWGGDFYTYSLRNTSIESLASKRLISVSHNSITGLLNVDLSRIEPRGMLAMHDIRGTRHYFTAFSKDLLVIDIKGWKPGMYIMSINGHGKPINMKLMLR